MLLLLLLLLQLLLLIVLLLLLPHRLHASVSRLGRYDAHVVVVRSTTGHDTHGLASGGGTSATTASLLLLLRLAGLTS